ncbi:putative quinol monooxygenase [Kribbella sp. NPDC003505]|uniref:putative quinol monooxygenase n=1 Tax=Kribbella sp. NPDC003505 TaxID=3154448 RepID=UPI0033BDB3E8
MTDPSTTLTSTVLLTVAVDIEPNRVADFREAVDRLVKSAIQEPGVLDYWVGQEPGNPYRFIFVERYADHDALAQHQASAACTEYVAALPGWLSSPTVASVDNATSVAVIDLAPTDPTE